MYEVRNAEENRQDYAKRKNEIISLLDQAIDYYEQEQQEDKTAAFRTLKHDLENGEFSIVVVGEFSAGKSTLLNALMRKRILPSFTNETTATVNFLRHSEKSEHGEAGTVFYHGGNKKDIEDISLETISKYVSTKGEEVTKSVDHLDVYLDSEFLKDGVTLVDSPGLNGVADGHREVTEAQILKSHASIFLFNSDHPGSKTDFEFLYELQKKVKTILFVLNKIDDIKEDEGETVESVIATLKENYKKQFPEETTVPEIWPVAAYPALVARNTEPMAYHGTVNLSKEERAALEESSRLEAFENRLINFLTCGEKAHQQLMAPIERVITVAKESKEQYEQEEKTLQSTVDTAQVENQIANIQDVIEGLEKQISESKKSVSSLINDAMRDVLEEFISRISHLQNKKLSEIDEFDDLNELMDYLQSFERNFVQRVYSIALEGEENLREKILAIVKMQYSQEAELLEQQFLTQDNVIQIEIKNHLETEGEIFEVGLKEMDEKTKILEDRLSQLKLEADAAEDDYYTARTKEKQRDKLEIELQNLQDSRDTIAAQMLPPVEHYTEEVQTKEHRGGILGTIGWLLFGGKNVTHQELRTNRTEHDAAKKSQDAQLQQKDSEITGRKAILEQYGTVDSSMVELKQMRKMAEVEEAAAKLERQQNENTQKILEKYQKEIKKVKRNLTDFCDEVTDELNRQVKKELRKSEDGYINAVLAMVEANVHHSMKEKQERIEQLKHQMEASEADRNQRVNELHGKIDRMNQLMSDAIDLQTELENITVDRIKNVAL